MAPTPTNQVSPAELTTSMWEAKLVFGCWRATGLGRRRTSEGEKELRMGEEKEENENGEGTNGEEGRRRERLRV